MASTYLTRTLGTPTSQKIFTFSTWLKKSLQDDAGTQHIFDSFYSVDNRLVIYFQGSSTDTFAMYNRSGASETMYMNTNMKFRDTNGWYHIYIAVDTTQSTASDRVKFYINGEQVTSWETSNYPAQNSNINIVSGYTNYIGRYGGGGNFFNGCMSHYYYVDGSVIDIAQFGSTDSTTGEWKINTNPTIASYGNQGFLILKDDNTITDQSPNSNNFTLSGGTLTKTEDCPSNVFCTLNPLFNSAGYFSGNTQSLSFSNGNTYAGKVTHGSYFGTLGVSSGKYYWEVKVEDTNTAFGIIAMKPNGGVTYAYDDATVNAYYPYGTDIYTNGTSAGGGGQYDNTSNKIYSFALDATNNKLWIGRDGTFTGDPVAGTGATWSSLPTGHDWTVFCHPMATTQNNNTAFNFGNGYFGTTAVSSAGTNASGNGIFEYDVPTGFTALSTKGLNL
jgi:hypothetical protein